MSDKTVTTSNPEAPVVVKSVAPTEGLFPTSETEQAPVRLPNGRFAKKDDTTGSPLVQTDPGFVDNEAGEGFDPPAGTEQAHFVERSEAYVDPQVIAESQALTAEDLVEDKPPPEPTLTPMHTPHDKYMAGFLADLRDELLYRDKAPILDLLGSALVEEANNIIHGKYKAIANHYRNGLISAAIVILGHGKPFTIEGVGQISEKRVEYSLQDIYHITYHLLSELTGLHAKMEHQTKTIVDNGLRIAKLEADNAQHIKDYQRLRQEKMEVEAKLDQARQAPHKLEEELEELQALADKRKAVILDLKTYDEVRYAIYDRLSKEYLCAAKDTRYADAYFYTDPFDPEGMLLDNEESALKACEYLQKKYSKVDELDLCVVAFNMRMEDLN